MNHDEQLKSYQRCLRDAVAMQLLIGLPVCFFLFWVIAVTQEFAPVMKWFPWPWYLLAPIAWLELAIPSVIVSLPPKPGRKL